MHKKQRRTPGMDSFPFIMEQLRHYARTNPYQNGAGYIFWGLCPDKPIDGKIFLKFFRRALVIAGMDEAEARQITFHAWRHFYTAYMADRVTRRHCRGRQGIKQRRCWNTALRTRPPKVQGLS